MRIKGYQDFVNENIVKSVGKKLFGWLKDNILSKLTGWTKNFYQSMLDGNVPKTKSGKPVGFLFLPENGSIEEQMKKYYSSKKNEAYAPLEFDKPEQDVVNVNTEEYMEIVKDAFRSMKRGGSYKPIFIYGASGIGKSAIVAECAKQLGARVDVLPVFLYSGMEDLMGVPSQITVKEPVIVDGELLDKGRGVTRFNPPPSLPTDDNGGKGGILFLDELNLSEQYILKKLQLFVRTGSLGDYQLPKGWLIVAAGNRESEADVLELSAPILRSFTVINFVPSLGVDTSTFRLTGDWAKYLSEKYDEKTISTEVIYFLAQNPVYFHRYDTEKRPVSFPSPATWEDAVKAVEEKCINDGVDNWRDIKKDKLERILKLSVGTDTANIFMEYLLIQMKLSSQDMLEILKDPEKGKLVKEFKSNKYYLYPIYRNLLNIGVKEKSGNLTEGSYKNILNIMKYISRYEADEIVATFGKTIWTEFPEFRDIDPDNKGDIGWDIKREFAKTIQDISKKNK